MNTPEKLCAKCIHLYWDPMKEEDPNYIAECSLDLPMGDENCSEFEETKPLGIMFKDLPDKKHPGKTIGEVNMEKKHNIPKGRLVEIKDSGVRLFVVGQGRDCDNTPLYWLSWDPELIKDKNSCLNWNWHLHKIGGYSEDELKIIKRSKIGVCRPRICQGFRLFPHLLNCISREKGDPRIYRWLWWNWRI